jgi:hypothetical protein
MWGPPDAVRFAVRENCARLGLDASKIIAYYPAFENGGNTLLSLFGGAKENLTIADEQSWRSTHIEAPTLKGNVSSDINNPHTKLSVILFIDNLVRGESETVLFRNRASWNVANGFTFYIVNSTNITLRYSNGSSYTTINGTDLRFSDTLSFGLWGFTFDAGAIELFHRSFTTHHTGSHTSIAQASYGPEMLPATSTYRFFGGFVTSEVVNKDIRAQLHAEPYTLLMPVARPLYFDLGSVEPGTEVEGPFAIIHSASLGIQGIKGVSSPAIFTHTCSVSLGGVKGALSPVTITHTNTFGVAGVKEEFGLGAGPLTITHTSSIGIGGIKGASCPVTITHTTLFGVAGIVGVLMPELSNAVGVGTGPRSAAGNVTTNKANGTLYAVLTLSDSKPSVAQIQAGQNHLGNAALFAVNQPVIITGEQSVVCPSGLTPLTTVYWHFQHKDDVAQESSVITSGAFSTQDIPIALSLSNTAPAKLQYVLVTSDMGITAEEIEELWGIA